LFTSWELLRESYDTVEHQKGRIWASSTEKTWAFMLVFIHVHFSTLTVPDVMYILKEIKHKL